MPMGKQSLIGANQIKEEDVGKTIDMLRSNRSIMVLPLNEDAGQDVDLKQCQTIKEVFDTFKPKAEISVRDEGGGTEETVLQFKEVKDFSPDAIIRMTPQLRRMKIEIAVLKDFLKQLQQNATLRRADGKPEEREKLMAGLKMALEALGQADVKK